MALTPKRAAFVREYLIDLNAAAAYRRAGYAVRNNNVAGVEGHRLLNNPNVAAAIAAAMQARARRCEITADAVLKELAMVAFSRMTSYAKWGSAGVVLTESETLDQDAAACVAEVSQTVTEAGGSIKFKLHDKVSALTLLGKHLGVFPDRHELTGANGGPIEVIHDDNWYSNAAHALAAARLATSGAGTPGSIEDESGGVRPPLGQECLGSNGDGEGPRSA